MHVVDETLVNRVSRAGISRAEPLDVCVSTAGNELECAGRRRFEYGRQVNAGERHDLQYLHVEYSVPDETTDEQLLANPLPYLKLANPAWGITIDEEEILADLEQSQDDPAQLSLFWQYRANRWTSSANAWLDMQGWTAGKRDFPHTHLTSEFQGRECFAGLDLSRVRDMTAFVLLFPWPEDHPDAVRVWPMFWLPEKTARKRDKIYPFMSWAQAGYVRLTEGSRIGYDQVKMDIRNVVKDNKLQLIEIAYDPHIANELTQSLVEGDVSRDGTVIEGGLGCERSEFRQYAAEYTGPTKEFEQMVQNGMILHPDNRVFNWQASLCEVVADVNQYIRPVKPNTRQTGKSIDGIAAAIMGLRPLLQRRAQKFLY
jgi:phage terminase large subunit-like protein